MPGFNCKNCGFDLSLRIDLIARSIWIDHPDADLSPGIEVDGICDDCSAPFNFSGPMFSNYLATKVEEQIISPEADNFTILDMKVTREEAELFKTLLAENRKDELTALLIRILAGRDQLDD